MLTMIQKTQQEQKVREIRPQKGKQERFLQSSADIVLYGGSAGGGKTYALLLECLRNIHIKGFGAVIFRSNLTQIVKEGALWDTATTLYPHVGGRGVKGNSLVYYFDAWKTKIQFSYLSRDEDVYAWQGTQIPLICFDELTHFTKKQFFYMLSRNRSTCSVIPYIRATTNPDPDSWIRDFIDWWIDDRGYAVEEKCGVIRWFINQNDYIFWFDTKDEALREFPTIEPKSFTFINSSVYDNEILIEQDKNYISNLQALPRVEQERLLYGNWDVTEGAGDYFKKTNFEIVDAVPKLIKTVRCWDFASTAPSETNPDPDWTVGLKAGIDAEGIFYMLDMVRVRMNPVGVKNLVCNTASQDGLGVYIRIPQDPGSAGKMVAQDFVKYLRGYKTTIVAVTGDKEVRAKPASSQAGINNIKLLRGGWNNAFLIELENFPVGVHDDIVDTLSDCIHELTTFTKGATIIHKPDFMR